MYESALEFVYTRERTPPLARKYTLILIGWLATASDNEESPLAEKPPLANSDIIFETTVFAPSISECIVSLSQYLLPTIIIPSEQRDG